MSKICMENSDNPQTCTKVYDWQFWLEYATMASITCFSMYRDAKVGLFFGRAYEECILDKEVYSIVRKEWREGKGRTKKEQKYTTPGIR